jgi:molecular chaperone DnaJ
MSLYSALAITEAATQRQIKLAYLKLAKIYHPDTQRANQQTERNKAKEQWNKITKAYEILADPQSRREYDRTQTNNKITNNSCKAKPTAYNQNNKYSYTRHQHSTGNI